MVSVSANRSLSQRNLVLDADRVDYLINERRFIKGDFDILYPLTHVSDEQVSNVARLKSTSKAIRRSHIRELLSDSQIADLYGRSNDLKRRRLELCYEHDLSIVELEKFCRELKSKRSYSKKELEHIKWLVEECHYTKDRLMKEYGYRVVDAFSTDAINNFEQINREEAERKCIERVRKYVDSNLSDIISGEITNAQISKDCAVLNEKSVYYLQIVLGDEYKKIKTDLKQSRYAQTCMQKYGSSNVFSSEEYKHKLLADRVMNLSGNLDFRNLESDLSLHKHRFENLEDVTLDDFVRLIEREGHSLSDVKLLISSPTEVDLIKSRLRHLSDSSKRRVMLKLRRSDMLEFASLHFDRILSISPDKDLTTLSRSELVTDYYVPESLSWYVIDMLRGRSVKTESSIIEEIIDRLTSDSEISRALADLALTESSLLDFIIGARSKRDESIDILSNLLNELYKESVFYDECDLLNILDIDFSRNELVSLSKSTNIMLSQDNYRMYKMSKYERKIYDLLSERLPHEQIIVNNRSTLNGLELDFLIESMSLAIEVHPIYRHHSNEVLDDKNRIYAHEGQTKDYHFDKLEKCRSSGIRLISLYEYDFEDARFEAFTSKLIKACLDIAEFRDRSYEFSLNTKSTDYKSCVSLDSVNDKYSVVMNTDDVKSVFYLSDLHDRSIDVLDIDIVSDLSIFSDERAMISLVDFIFSKFEDCDNLNIRVNNDYFEFFTQKYKVSDKLRCFGLNRFGSVECSSLSKLGDKQVNALFTTGFSVFKISRNDLKDMIR